MDRLHKYGKRLTQFNYNNKEIADEIYSAINSTQFLGISVRFDRYCLGNNIIIINLISGFRSLQFTG